MDTFEITPCPGGFVTTRLLPDGRTLVEGWALNFTPMHTDDPSHEVAYHHVAADAAETAATVADFAAWLDQPLGA